ncbi:PhrK family phosphatase-inhibitory pheromone [Bacillus sp. CLL-7-23]|uniref:PhrK family phosphatase-inhibitory pheromone n=1 Tax=Bacillus changyiensis TaxID=3004103 RepID=A0ABT4X5V5_9BACI|nr:MULTISPECIES: PhrK family phosphatase-inhibitory pheromone [Bacillus]MDA1477153.1 PhrK family phosphatase-inhibitory pheromone [Bacillus changyiensis]MDA7026752.1 PhrK family phosphatase-inhibitory pheromone [Bacillus changyiensis]NPC91792.1 PhrK family phosphatase-inhibitory pheromone [Bacillus sp. WMMC1349]
MKKMMICLSLVTMVLGGAALSQQHNHMASGDMKTAELPVGG